MPTSTTTRLAAGAAVALLGVVTLAACSSGSKTPSLQQATNTNGTGNQGTNARTAPGAFGTIASLDATSMQVQNQQQGQTQVTFTSSTPVEQEKTAKLSDVATGSCVVVTGTSDSSSTTSLTGTRVMLSEPVDGKCSTQSGLPGAGGGAGGFFGGGAGNRFGNGANPSFSPRPRPSRSPGARGSFQGGGSFTPMGFASGSVTQVAGDVITISGVIRQPRIPNGGTDGAPPTAAPSPDASSLPTQTITVTVSADTTYSQTVKAATSALKLGQCVSALGKADDVGAIAATSITIRESAESCTATRFGGFGGRGGGTFSGGGQAPAAGGNG